MRQTITRWMSNVFYSHCLHFKIFSMINTFVICSLHVILKENKPFLTLRGGANFQWYMTLFSCTYLLRPFSSGNNLLRKFFIAHFSLDNFPVETRFLSIFFVMTHISMCKYISGVTFVFSSHYYYHHLFIKTKSKLH